MSVLLVAAVECDHCSARYHSPSPRSLAAKNQFLARLSASGKGWRYRWENHWKMVDVCPDCVRSEDLTRAWWNQ